MKRFVLELAILSLRLLGVVFVVPLIISLFALGRENAYMLLVMLLIGALVGFVILMLPCLRFVWMIRRQEKKRLLFQSTPLRQFESSMTRTYLTEDWLIHAGYVALHRSRITAIQHEKDHSRFGFSHRIFVLDTDGHIYRWRLSKVNIRTVLRWWKDGPASLTDTAKEK